MESLYDLKYEILNLKNLDVAFWIQKETWPDDPDYDNLYDKAIRTEKDNCFFLIYDKDILIGITGVDVYEAYPDTIWLDWFTILPEHRRKGYGKKVLLDTISYCKKLGNYDYFRVDTTYYVNRPAIILYDKIMPLKEDYIAEDTEDHKNYFIIYSYGLNGKLEPWNNKYLGLRSYCDKCNERNKE